MALSAEASLLHALGVHEVTESHEAERTDSEDHNEFGETVEASLVVVDLALVLLDVLKELNGVRWLVKVFLIHDFLHVLFLGELLLLILVVGVTVTERLHLFVILIIINSELPISNRPFLT